MMCTTVLHGGVFHRTSTPHKSGNKMQEKKKKNISLRLHYSNRKQCTARLFPNLTPVDSTDPTQQLTRYQSRLVNGDPID